MAEASSLPSREYTADSALPSPGVKKSSSPSRRRRSETSGLPSAQCSAAAAQAEASARSLFKNFSLAGVLKKISRTVMLVPSGQPQGTMSTISPACTVTATPSAAPFSRVTSSTRLTADIAARASPRKPIVPMASRPFSSRSLLVAWRRKATPASSGLMPQPSSVTRMKVAPPFLNSTLIFPAPASSAFSTSSFITDAGLSTTSPAAIMSATSGGSMFIFVISQRSPHAEYLIIHCFCRKNHRLLLTASKLFAAGAARGDFS